MKLFFTIFMGFYALLSYATEPDSVKVSNYKKELDEVVVTASYLTREDGHIFAVPTKEQRKHALTGYDLLRNLMLPGVSVNRTSGSITTPAGTATLYIDGREVEFREVQSLRPKDIARVEYFDIPTGKYAKDAAAINFVLRTINNGGYTQLDAMQGLGYLNGDYNLISKYAVGTKSINLWAGYSIENPKSTLEGTESFDSTDGILDRSNFYSNVGNRDSEGYVQASISNRGNKYIWMLRGGMALTDNKNDVGNGIVNYTLTDVPFNDGVVNLNIKNKAMRPSLYFFGMHTFSENKRLDYVADAYYSRNDFNRQYKDNDDLYRSIVKEDYWYTKLNANYTWTLNHQNNLVFSFYEFLRVSDSNYSGTAAYNQNLHSSETIFFTDYSQRLGRFFYDINPGLSFLTYRLKDMNSINHVTPRLQARVAYMIDRKQQLQFAFSLGNTYPRISTINNVEQQIDPIIIVKGNPHMDNSILISPRLSYNIYINKISLQAGVSYFYQDHSIISDYYIRDGNLISTFRDDCIYHKPSVDLSLTYKPFNALNIKISGQWKDELVRGGVRHRQLSTFDGSVMANYYVGDFSFGTWVSTPIRDLVDSQIRRNTFWQYQLSSMWTHGNWAIEVNANNLFLMNNRIMEELNAAAYSYKQTNWNRQNNQYATFKVAYTFEYGKKTNRSPKYQHQDSESAILK
jgi:hypothetical protein